MKNFKIAGTLVIVLFLITSCGFFKRIRYHLNNFNSHGHSQNCSVISESTHPAIWKLTKDIFLNVIDFKKKDTIVSIGVGSGSQEFLFSVFTDSITFYLEDLDTSCITTDKIKNIYLPHYSAIKGRALTNNFIVSTGTDTTVNLNNNTADKVLIFNVYHHFSNDIAMVKECKRILKPNGKLIIHEAILRRNRSSFRFCDFGGYYKSEKNFIKDITCTGLKCDTVYKLDKFSRIFVFNNQ
jgi:SAM-dependent methyltransferase